MSFDLGNGAVTLSNGSGQVLLTAAGLAAGISGTVDVNVPDVSFGTDLNLSINTTGAAVVDAGLALDLPAGPFFRLAADNIDLTALLARPCRATSWSNSSPMPTVQA